MKMTLFSMRKMGIFIKKDFCLERCLKKKNYIETKPVVAAKYLKPRNLIGLTKAGNIGKIYTDILGNEKIVYKERFKLSID